MIHMPPEVVPLSFLRPISGSPALATVTDIFEHLGPDSMQGKIASIMMGSTETTFYTIAVYFGSSWNKKYTLHVICRAKCGFVRNGYVSPARTDFLSMKLLKSTI